GLGDVYKRQILGGSGNININNKVR
ncbi:MAG: hypothetical protein CI948_2305, partial [Halanaerobium sp.]